jgi:hypothetical protein
MLSHIRKYRTELRNVESAELTHRPRWRRSSCWSIDTFQAKKRGFLEYSRLYDMSIKPEKFQEIDVKIEQNQAKPAQKMLHAPHFRAGRPSCR